MTESVTKTVMLSPATHQELVKLLAEDDGRKHLVFQSAAGNLEGVVLSRWEYNFLRTAADIVEDPERAGFKLKPLWDQGPRLKTRDVFGGGPLPLQLRFRIWLYDKRVAFYRKVGLRSEAAE